MRVLITGGAGFVGTHLARRWLGEGAAVTVFDDLSRSGSPENLAALRREHPDAELRHFVADVRDESAVAAAIEGQQAVFHLAAQVAVTTSVADPRRDFEINALGTLNVLDAARRQSQPPFLLFSSTNKVYGALAGAGRSAVIDEDQPLDFHSPYGCSKGAADQYVRDFARIYCLPSVVFRMSCIFGPGQYGSEDQGWVAHFARAAFTGRTITLFGDGEQERDLLYVADLVEAMMLAWRERARCAGAVFNLGGGTANVRSLRQVIAALEAHWQRPLALAWAPPRPGDQRRYCTDSTRFRRATGWQPRVGAAAGLARLCAWLEAETPLSERTAA